MSLRDVWSGEQRRNLISQLYSTSRAFVAALPAEDAIDGLIMNLHLCLALDLAAQEVQQIFGQRTLTFLAGMLAASQTESLSPRYKAQPMPGLACRRPLVATRIGTIGTDRRLHPDAGTQHGLDQGTIQLVFRSRPSRPLG